MSKFPIEAHISVINGPYYPVKLNVIPRVGEFIDLHSFIDQQANLPCDHYYQVVRVVHKIHDVPSEDSSPQPLKALIEKGHQLVTVYVKPSSDKLLD